MTYFDAEKLILEVQKRPSLYDPAMPEYFDKIKRSQLWEELCSEMTDNWEDLDQFSQSERVHGAQRRWRSLRDCFRREIAFHQNAAANKNGRPVRKRKYLYFNHLSFLTNTLKNLGDDNADSSNVSNIDGVQAEEEQSEVRDTSPQPQSQPKPVPPSVSIPTGRQRLRRSGKKHTRTEPLNSTASLPIANATVERNLLHAPVNGDEAFFVSILPMVDRFDEDQKLEFRTEVLNVIKKIKSTMNPLQSPFQPYHLLAQAANWHNVLKNSSASRMDGSESPSNQETNSRDNSQSPMAEEDSPASEYSTEEIYLRENFKQEQ